MRFAMPNGTVKRIVECRESIHLNRRQRDFTVKEESKKSKVFKKFEAYFFGDDDLSLPMSHVLDISTVSKLEDEEKKTAEKMLIAALTKKYDRRWIYALEELKTETAYQFLFDWYNREEVEYTKIRLTYSLVRIDGKAPVLEYVQKILSSKATKDSKMRALNCFFWIKEAGLEDKEKEQLFLSILYSTLIDKTKEVRLYTYEILTEYYNTKDFTPIDDEVYRILSKTSRRTEYQRAAQLFEDRLRSMKAVPAKRKVIVDHIKNLPDNPPSLDVSECRVCSTIPDDLTADIAAGESLDVHKSKLERMIIFAYYSNCILRCPVCGRLYRYKYEYEFLVGMSSEEDEWLWRIDTEGAMELVDSFLKSYDFKHIVTSGIFLKITY